ncbi:recombinase family protein [Microbacterium sp. NPDC089698]|uniref:recombinase family protein n=1 Tax=Microbacterium sp. NPDC089698 TaxID=3364200 RepID=UPI00382B48D0
MEALIIARVSQDASGRERSIDEQLADNIAWCEREGWTVTHTIRELGGISRHSKRTVREELAEALEWIRSGKIQILITWELSRASRDLQTFALLRDECRTHGVRWGYSGKLRDFDRRSSSFRAGWDALLAEHETDRTSDRVRRSMSANARAGRPHGKQLFGYVRRYDEHTKHLISVDVDEQAAAVVREAATRYLAGESLHAIARSFEDRGVPTRRPAVKAPPIRSGWTGTAIRQMLSNPAYAGVRAHHGTLVEAVWPAIVARAEWDRIQVMLEDPDRARRGDRTVFDPKHLMSGVALCGRPGCGAPLVAGTNTSRMSTDGRTRLVKYPAYVCQSGLHLTAKASHVDAIVTEHVLARMERQDFVSQLMTAEGPEAARRRELVAAIEADEAWLEQVRGRAEAEARMDLLFSQEEIVLPKLNAARKELAMLSPIGRDVLDVAEATDVRAAWAHLAVREQREIIRALATVTILPALKVGQRGIEASIARTRIEWKDQADG